MRGEFVKIGGLAAALLLVWLGALLWGGTTSGFDVWLSSVLYLGAGDGFASFWRMVTELGGWKVLIGLTALAFVYLMIRRRALDAWFLLGVVLGVRALVEVQKLAFARPRPEVRHLAEVSSYSFPSGHAANALATYAALAVLLAFGTWPRVGVAVLVGAIGVSRVLLGVHWPSDVLGGWALAAFWLLIAFQFRAKSLRP